MGICGAVTLRARSGLKGVAAWEWSGLPAPLQLRLQFPDPGLGGIGEGFKVLVSDDVLPGLRVVPAQLSVVPPEEEIEYAAVPLQDPFLDRLNGDRFIPAIHHPISGQTVSVGLPGLVEPPVLGNPQAGVGRPLLYRVLLAGGP